MGEDPLPAGHPGPGGRRHLSDRGGFDDFYQASYSRLTAQVHAYLGDRSEAEDVVQEAFIRSWQRWSEVSRYDDPVAWVRRVAWNLATSRLRRVNVATRFLRRHDPPPNAPALSPDHVVLVAALRRLPDRQRLAMVLHYIADLPVADIATDLGVPKGTVVSWLHRGRSQLAGHLATAEVDTGAGRGTTAPAITRPSSATALRKR